MGLLKLTCSWQAAEAEAGKAAIVLPQQQVVATVSHDKGKGGAVWQLHGHFPLLPARRQQSVMCHLAGVRTASSKLDPTALNFIIPRWCFDMHVACMHAGIK